MAGIARRHGAVEYTIAHMCTSYNVEGMSYAERVHRELRGNQFPRIGEDIGQQIAIFVERPPAVAIAVEADLKQRLRAALA